MRKLAQINADGIEAGDGIRSQVRKRYEAIVQGTDACCDPTPGSSVCCGGMNAAEAAEVSTRYGYDVDDLRSEFIEANLGLGCGNPRLIASLKQGETVVDLGSGAGFDCFIARRAVGEAGYVIGVDMTPAMVVKARSIALRTNTTGVEFRLGEIEHLPIADEFADVVISNCVINLAPEKARVYREAFRVLKSGGRLAVADMVAVREIPKEVAQDMTAYTGCVAGAELVSRVHTMLEEAGFIKIEIDVPGPNREAEFVVSALISAQKP